MASTGADVPLTGLAEPLGSPRPWRVGAGLASVADRVEAFLAGRPFERGPWLAAAFAAGIGAWFVLPDVGRWLAWLAACAGLAVAGLAAFGREGRHPLTRVAVVATALMLAAGMATVWTKSALVGAEGLVEGRGAAGLGQRQLALGALQCGRDAVGREVRLDG